MPPEASGPVFTVRKPTFIGPAWARRIAGAAISALAPNSPCSTVRRWTFMASLPPLDRPAGRVFPSLAFRYAAIILTYRTNHARGGLNGQGAPRQSCRHNRRGEGSRAGLCATAGGRRGGYRARGRG